jgi:transposase, IS5 family
VYRQQEPTQKTPEKFELPFEGKLSSNNRWVIMSKLIPWSDFEGEYASLFSEEMGAPAKTFRIALGSLIIKEKLGTSELETVEQIRENPYLQYFIGLSSYSNDVRFNPSMLSHIRPIVRGKAGSSVEFGAKISASCVQNYIFLDHLSWDNFNESQDFIQQVESFKEKTGAYPLSVHVDKIYRTRKNRAFCQEKGIRMSGSPLGRPPKNISIETKRQATDDERVRNLIEGKFGQGKRRFSLSKIMTKLPSTSSTSIAIIFLVMNLSRLLKEAMRAFLCQFLKTRLFFELVMMRNYSLAS